MASRRSVPGRQLGALLPRDRLPLVSRSLGIGAELRQSDGLTLSVRMRGGLTASEIAQAKGSTAIARMLKQTMLSEGAAGVRQLQQLTRFAGTVDTGLLLSSWGFVLTGDQKTRGLKLQIAYTNDAPYARYVHPKKDGRLLIGYYATRFVKSVLKPQLLAALKTLKPRIANVVKIEAAKALKKSAAKARAK